MGSDPNFHINQVYGRNNNSSLINMNNSLENRSKKGMTANKIEVDNR